MNGYQTEQKRLLLDYLSRHAERAFTPAELAQALADGGIGKSTVYRLIARLSEEGAVRRFAREGGGVAYQYLSGEHCASHLHLRCTACGRVIHLSEIPRIYIQSVRFEEQTNYVIPAIFELPCQV